jgi:hypothetical protein
VSNSGPAPTARIFESTDGGHAWVNVFMPFDNQTTNSAASLQPRHLEDRGSDPSVTMPNHYRLPSFLGVGPPRTGTTWLHEVLKGRANLPRRNKETRFFDAHYAKGLKWYATHFDRWAPALPVGEICPTYFYSEPARNRIAGLIPKVKIICTFRDPVERVFSLYRIKRVYGATRWTLDEALSRDPELLESSRYAFHLSRWQTLFGMENVLIAIYDDLIHDPQAYLGRIVDFIGIPPFPLTHWQLRRVNSSERLADPLSPHWAHFASTVAEWLKAHRLGAFVTVVKRSVLRGLFLGGGADIPSLDASAAARLRELFRPEVEQLEAMLHRDLSRWKSQ